MGMLFALGKLNSVSEMVRKRLRKRDTDRIRKKRLVASEREGERERQIET